MIPTRSFFRRLLALVGWVFACVPRIALGSDFHDPNADSDALPAVPAGFEISVFAREPTVRQPCSMAFDTKGRLCVGMGPQYRNPKPETPGDSVVLVLDTDGDGRADATRVFASGFNAIQGLAWRGQELWIANAPDLTVVRDLDGDDEADEYVRMYTDLGNLEHGLHGLNFAPDGKLYMSKGNSKGLTVPGRMAPKAFRDLWGVRAPEGTVDIPPPELFRKGEYRRAYHDPEDDWGLEGGVLRCDPDGTNLEIVARGFRNPWDITFDSGFNWLGTDNDQTTGDRVFMPFAGAHFGWNHPWSAHWSDAPHAPSAPVSGPLFEGSGTGVVYGDSPRFPASYRGVFLVNDWLRKTTYVWRPRWDGALLRPEGTWEPFVRGQRALYRPTDLEFGPDGALWILGWSRGYGAEYQDGQFASEGRIFRVVWSGLAAEKPAGWPGDAPNLGQSMADLIGLFDSPVASWKVEAGEILSKRGVESRAALEAEVRQPGSVGRETWSMWTLGRMAPRDAAIDALLEGVAMDSGRSVQARVQALRVRASRARGTGMDWAALPDWLRTNLEHAEPRLRFESVLAIREMRAKGLVPALWDRVAVETDPTVFYSGWQALRILTDSRGLEARLGAARGKERLAAMLALLEDHRLDESATRALAESSDAALNEWARHWLEKASTGGESRQLRGRPLAALSDGVLGERYDGPALVRNVRVRSAASYVVVPGGLRAGAPVYSDRTYTLEEVPSEWVGLDYIQTANDDDGCRGDDWLSFEAIRPVRVRVALDARSSHVPEWLRSRFRRESGRIQADHWWFTTHVAEFPAGRVVLGGNTDDGNPGGKGQYLVFVEASDLDAPNAPTRTEAVLGRMAGASVTRGEWLFHHPRGAGCVQCHRLGGRGNAFGPDLLAMGERGTVRHVIESIVSPNAVITEGFRQQTLEMADEVVSGILLEESGLSITLGLANGRRETFERSKVISRRTGAGSAMPAFDATLQAADVADLAAYLLREPEKSGSTTASKGFGFESGAESLVFSYDGRRLAEFVFRDAKILRPYFANLRTLGGTAVTRAHPPVAGRDATDHDTMHPGIWLAFGDVSGFDFWRNQGRIEHERFRIAPEVREGRLRFATESRLVDVGGNRLCGLVQSFEIATLGNSWRLDWTAEFRSGDREIVFGDQEEMGFGARVATGITEKNGGIIRSSSGRTTAAATWGQAAEWCDYSGVVDGVQVGVMLMGDPANFRRSWWHNRDYGVFVANPFGRASMRQGAPSAVAVGGGDRLRIRFGAVVHSGDGFDPAPAYRAFTD